MRLIEASSFFAYNIFDPAQVPPILQTAEEWRPQGIERCFGFVE